MIRLLALLPALAVAPHFRGAGVVIVNVKNQPLDRHAKQRLRGRGAAVRQVCSRRELGVVVVGEVEV